MAASNLRFGMGATREVGMDFTNMIAQLSGDEKHQAKIGVFTDPNVARLPVMKVVEESLMKEGLNFVIFDKISVEPTDNSWQVSLDIRHSFIGPRLWKTGADCIASN
jgi:hydroxyacid-oxoacid transhydrogenase